MKIKAKTLTDLDLKKNITVIIRKTLLPQTYLALLQQLEQAHMELKALSTPSFRVKKVSSRPSVTAAFTDARLPLATVLSSPPLMATALF